MSVVCGTNGGDGVGLAQSVGYSDQATRWTTGLRYPAAQDISLRYNVHTDYGTRRASHPTGARVHYASYVACISEPL